MTPRESGRCSIGESCGEELHRAARNASSGLAARAWRSYAPTGRPPREGASSGEQAKTGTRPDACRGGLLSEGSGAAFVTGMVVSMRRRGCRWAARAGVHEAYDASLPVVGPDSEPAGQRAAPDPEPSLGMLVLRESNRGGVQLSRTRNRSTVAPPSQHPQTENWRRQSPRAQTTNRLQLLGVGVGTSPRVPME
jgi:hypothetical protein